MPRYHPFANRPKSTRVTQRRYPEEWAWWQASGWQMMVEEAAKGGLHLCSFKSRGMGFAVWGASATAEQLTTPDSIRRFLTTTLYFHLHPRKSRKMWEATGEACDEKQLQAFIRQQQRKVAGL